SPGRRGRRCPASSARTGGPAACANPTGAPAPGGEVCARLTVALRPPPSGPAGHHDRRCESMRQIAETRGGVVAVAPRFNGPPGEPTVAPRPAPSLAAARHATRRYAAADPDRHIFPTCVVCGPLRPDDGLHVFPGPLSAGDVLACPWTPAPGLGGE